MTEFTAMIVSLIAIVAALIAVIVRLNDAEMNDAFPESRRREKARMMSEEWKR